MESLAQYLNCNLIPYEGNKILSVSITSLDKLSKIINYFNNFPLLGIIGKDINDLEKIYYMMKAGKHLTDSGKKKIKALQANMYRNITNEDLNLHNE